MLRQAWLLEALFRSRGGVFRGQFLPAKPTKVKYDWHWSPNRDACPYGDPLGDSSTWAYEEFCTDPTVCEEDDGGYYVRKSLLIF